MKVPRGPVVERGVMTREWEKFFEALARDKGLPRIPRGDVDERQWTRWFEALGAETLPRGPFVDERGDVTGDWSDYLEAL